MNKRNKKSNHPNPRVLVAFAICMILIGVGSVRSNSGLTGKVVDQHGMPVSGAKVTCSLSVPLSLKAYSRSAQTDAEGRFKIKCYRPFAYYIVAEHPDYIKLPPWQLDPPSSSSNSPTQRGLTLTLLNDGLPGMVVRKRGRSHSLAPGQAPLRIDLDTQGEHVVEFIWDPEAPSGVLPSRQLPIPGKLSLRALGGKVVERSSDGYLAPKSGWHDEGVLAKGIMSASGSWSVSNGNQQFYIRYDDGTHARIEMGVFATSEGCRLESESTYNANPASRWLFPPG